VSILKRILAAAALTVPWLVVAGCGDAPGGDKPGGAARASSEEGFPLTVTDVLGRRVALAKPPERIISLAPRNTEILFAVGAGDRIVGVTSFCNYPPEAAKREHVGGFSGPTINLEKIVALRPDVVFTAGNLHEPLIERLENLGLTVVALYAESFEEMHRELELVGRVTGRRKQAKAIATDLKQRIGDVHDKAKSIPAAERRSVMYLVADEPLIAAGPASFIGKLIENCGGENVFADVEQAYPQIGEESMLARNPDVLLAPSSLDTPAFRARLAERPAFSKLKAVREGNIVFLNEDLLSRCGPRSADAQYAVAKAIYPDYFGKP
jgi:iron complex transport system substrate-binding protein